LGKYRYPSNVNFLRRRGEGEKKKAIFKLESGRKIKRKNPERHGKKDIICPHRSAGKKSLQKKRETKLKKTERGKKDSSPFPWVCQEGAFLGSEKKGFVQDPM